MPAGLMAAETIAKAVYKVHVYDTKPSAARKFLLAGVGGLNITHAEDWSLFISRYGQRQADLHDILQHFGPEQLRTWVHDLGIATFIGSSMRVFPTDMKAAPLLRAWLQRLRGQGVEFFMRHRCLGWNQEGQLCFATPEGQAARPYAATVLAMGGGSWPQLGSDGCWQNWFNNNITIRPLMPANCGFDVNWTQLMREKHAGSHLKNIALGFTDHKKHAWQKRGEFIISQYGIEGSVVYAMSAALRETLLATGKLAVHIDLRPDHTQQQLTALLQVDRKGISLASLLRKKLKFSSVEMALLHECTGKDALQNPAELAKAIKSASIALLSPRPLAEAISSAGGIAFENLDQDLMFRSLPGVFCAGEMLDWEAPTGGYLLTACFATGRAAGEGVIHWLER